MIIRSSHIITLPSGNFARDFRWEFLGYGRVLVQYNYTDRRRAHQTARRFTVEFLDGKVKTIQALSAKGGRIEFFKTSSIINELLEMLDEYNEIVNCIIGDTEQDALQDANTVVQDVGTVEQNGDTVEQDGDTVEQDVDAVLQNVDTVLQDVDNVDQDVDTDNTPSDTITDLKETIKILGGLVMINMIVILVTLGIVGYNLSL